MLSMVARISFTKQARLVSSSQLGVSSNFRKFQNAKLRLAVVCGIKSLWCLNGNELSYHIWTMICRPIVGECLRYLVECGEKGLIREILGYVGESSLQF